MTKKLITLALTGLLALTAAHGAEDNDASKKKGKKAGKEQRANIGKRFKKLDKNEDSKLDLKEFSALPAMKKAGEERAKEVFGKIDTTKDDGGITLAEFKAGRKHLAKKAKGTDGAKKKKGEKRKKKSSE